MLNGLYYFTVSWQKLIVKFLYGYLSTTSEFTPLQTMYPQLREYVAGNFASECQWKADSNQGKFFGVTDVGDLDFG